MKIIKMILLFMEVFVIIWLVSGICAEKILIERKQKIKSRKVSSKEVIK